MDILTLELLDVTVFQALLELRGLLADHPGEAMCIRGEDDLLRVNVTGFLEKQGRVVRATHPLLEPTDPRPTAEQRLITMEQQRRALARLKPLDRALFQLCAIEGESLRSAAAKVGLEYKTAWVRMESAKRRLGST